MTRTRLVMASLLAVAVFSIAATPGALAQSNSFTHGTTDPDSFDNSDGMWWGFFTQEEATDSGRSFGEHASSSGGFAADPGRDGLGNLSQATGGWCGLLVFLGFGCA
jgi:hypothetical protein